MVPTDIGIAFAKGCSKIDPIFVSPSLRSDIEEGIIKGIVENKQNCDVILNTLLLIFKEKFRIFQNKIDS